jgi:hypothetical protein
LRVTDAELVLVFRYSVPSAVNRAIRGAYKLNVVVADVMFARFLALTDTGVLFGTNVPTSSVTVIPVSLVVAVIPVPRSGYVHVIGSVFAAATLCAIVMVFWTVDVSSVILPRTGAGLGVPSAGVCGVNTSYEIAVAAFPAGLVALFSRENTEAAGRRTAVVPIVNTSLSFACVVIVTPSGRLPVSAHVIVPVFVAVCVIVTVLAVAVFT